MNSNKNYAASVIVCTYRREKVLCDTLQQLITQQNSTYEIVVIDQTQQHTADTAAFLEDFRQQPGVQYHLRDTPGLAAARNFGAQVAKGDLLVYCDDDVILCENYVSHYLVAFKNSDIAAIAGQVINQGEQPRDAPGHFFHNQRIEGFDEIYGANFGIRKAIYHEIGGIDEQLGVHAYTEDRVLAMELRRHDKRICFEPRASVRHLADPVGGCRISDLSQQTRESEKSFSKWYFYFRYPHLPRRERWKTLRQALRHGPLRRHVVVRPWRQPLAWWGFVSAGFRAWRATRDRR